jgi:hypothetical protein
MTINPGFALRRNNAAGSATMNIPIKPLAAAGHACGDCHDTPSGPVCSASKRSPASTPTLIGPTAEVAQLLNKLSAECQGQRLADAVVALRLEPGEVELTLSVPPRCGGAELADQAFKTLRRLLPDTDIYITHAA